MPRIARIEYAGACYHVINRGNHRKAIFESEGAREAFERTLFEACTRFAWRLHAYVIMRNHFHLAVETPAGNLSAGMKWLQATWVARFNRLRGIVGRPFQGRFKSLLVEPGHALAEVAHYIHLNPVRAGVVSSDTVGSFRWSSLHYFPTKRRPAFLDGFTVRAEAGGLPDTTSGWRRYRAYLALRMTADPTTRQESFGRLSRGWCVGSAAFREEMKQRLVEPTGAAGRQFGALEPLPRRQEMEHRWTQQLAAAAQAAKLELDRLPVKKSDPAKVRVAAAMKIATDVSNGWLAQHLQMGEPASVSQFVRRFRLGQTKPDAAFAAIVSRVEQCPL